jgi:hypothetical protein
MKLDKRDYIAIAIFILLILWWFRYDTHCNSSNGSACVAYDRFTGQWISPIIEIRNLNED